MLVTWTDYDTFTIALNPGQTLSIQVTPQTAGLEPVSRFVSTRTATTSATRPTIATTGYTLLQRGAHHDRRDVHDLRL